jgi:hypothetical protein
MASSDRRENIFDLTEPIVGLFAEELESEVKTRLSNPRQLRRALTKRLGGIEYAATDFGRQVDRDEKTHAGSWLSRRPTPMAR